MSRMNISVSHSIYRPAIVAHGRVLAVSRRSAAILTGRRERRSETF